MAATNHVPKLRCPWAPRRVGSFSVLCTVCVTPFGILTVSLGMKIQIRTAFATMDGRQLELLILFTFFKALTKSVDFFVQMSVVELLEFYLCPSTSATLVHDVEFGAQQEHARSTAASVMTNV